MKHLFLFAFLFPLLMSCNTETASVESGTNNITDTNQESDMKELLRHVVLIKFKEGTSPEDIKKVEDAFHALEGKIKEIRDYEWGINNSPEGNDKGFTHCFFVTFESEGDRDIYLPHPDHQAFVQVLIPHLEDVLVVDYWAK
jgi:hypothetical protein